MAPNTKSQSQPTKQKSKSPPVVPTASQQDVVKDVKKSSVVEDAELAQWLEFTADVALRKNLTDDQAMVYLLFLNKALTGRAFLTGPRSTSADTTLHAALRDILSKLSFLDKERIPHVGRWFSHLQSLKGQKSARVIFSLTPLY